MHPSQLVVGQAGGEELQQGLEGGIALLARPRATAVVVEGQQALRVLQAGIRTCMGHVTAVPKRVEVQDAAGLKLEYV